MGDVRDSRVRKVNDKPVRDNGQYVLYWMTANRRCQWNHALDRALDLCRKLDRPLMVLEALRCGYSWAGDRIHRFVMDGMLDNGKAFEKVGIRYFAYVEREKNQGKGLLEHLAQSACCVVADDWPHFFLPRALKAGAQQVDVQMEAVDSVGLRPVWGMGPTFAKPFSRAFDFRRFLQRELPKALDLAPKAEPLARWNAQGKARLPKGTAERWPEAVDGWLRKTDTLASLPIDHGVLPTGLRGGSLEASRQLKAFVPRRLASYNDKRTELDGSSTSGLSPFLHFGHIGSFQVLHAIAKVEGWNKSVVQNGPAKGTGSREGWWKMTAAAETYMDQLVTWRELGFHRSAHDPQFGTFAGLPEWARMSLAEHATDKRPYVYTLEQFERAQTHDELWNAAQNQLLQEGIIHNYLRMLWGKKILHWSKSPEAAFAIMEQLNNKYCLDGRDPNSYSGIGWVLGLFDRAWGPERPIFGKIRYMTSDSTRRKLRVKGYIQRFNRTQEQAGLFE